MAPRGFCVFILSTLLLISGCDFLSASSSVSYNGTFETKVSYPVRSRLSTGTAHSCVLSDDKNIYCWGSNQYGQLGSDQVAVGSTSAIAVRVYNSNPNDPWIEVAVGGNHSCGVKASQKVFCWGSNDKLESGLSVLTTAPNDKFTSPQELLYFDGSNFVSFSVSGVKAISLSAKGGCILAADRLRYACWGVDSIPSGSTSGRNWYTSTFLNSTMLAACTPAAACSYATGSTSKFFYARPMMRNFDFGAEPLAAAIDFHYEDNLCWSFLSPIVDGNSANDYKMKCVGPNVFQLDWWAASPVAKSDATLRFLYLKHYAAGEQDGDARCPLGSLNQSNARTCIIYYNSSLYEGRGLSTGYQYEDATGTVNIGGVGTELPFVNPEVKRMDLSSDSFACKQVDATSVVCSGSNASSVLANNSTFSGLNALGLEFDFARSVTPPSNGQIHRFGDTIQSFSIGGGTLCALLEDGSVECLGENGSGQTGIYTASVPVSIPNQVTFNDGI